jgi:predicted enzyme related to lactoylglutathione lyase
VNFGDRDRVNHRLNEGAGINPNIERGNVYNRAENVQRNADRATAQNKLRQARPSANRANNVFADQNGNLFAGNYRGAVRVAIEPAHALQREKEPADMKPRLSIASLVLLTAIAACATVADRDLSGMSFSEEPLLGKVIWHDLITEDLDKSQTFYAGMFGWTFEDGAGPGRGDYVLAREGNVYVAGFVPIAAPQDGTRLSRWLPYVSVNDVDETVDLTVAAGGRVAASARNVSLGRVAAVVDPEGAVIGLARSKIGDPDDVTTAAGAGRVVWTELLSNDPAAAATYYKDTVGYNAREIERRGGTYTYLTGDGIDRAGILQNPSPEWSPLWLTYFGVADVAAAVDKAVGLGGKILVPLSPDLRDGTMAVVADPAGAVLVLQKLMN